MNKGNVNLTPETVPPVQCCWSEAEQVYREILFAKPSQFDAFHLLGLGDTLPFVRYAPMVARLGAKVPLEVQPPLLRLLSDIDGVSAVIAQGEKLTAFDLQCPR
jgi:hypothetical protein